jgi:chemosensory pili system protein ChpA (sensor histidine kinase/response regulator)
MPAMAHEPGLPTVLLVDDEPTIRQFFAKTLEIGGYASVEAATGEAALRLLQNGLCPDAVLLDLTMPGMGGLGFLLRLRSDPRCSTIPVAIVTGHAVLPAPVQLAAEKFNVAVHHKPVNMEQLLELTEGLLRPPPRAH